MSSGCRVVADLRRTMPPRIGKDSYRPLADGRDRRLSEGLLPRGTSTNRGDDHIPSNEGPDDAPRCAHG
jgi:hypothetical protein